MDHPYRSAPDRAFWKRAMSNGPRLADVASGSPLIRKSEAVASAGSCFASNIVPYLEQAGFNYIRIPEYGTVFEALAEDNFGYSKFSARYGNIYTVRQMVQLLHRALGRFTPLEDRWVVADKLIIDPFRPGLKYPASSHLEFDVLTSQHLRSTLDAFRKADVFVFTLGLTEAWVSRVDGSVFPACPGTIAGTFNPEHHIFHNFSAKEVAEDLDEFIRVGREINPKLRFILTVSPVPLVATATDSHVLLATTYSKSVLRVAAGEAAQKHSNVTYFPAYEIVTGPHAPYDFFESDRREPSARAIRHVMAALIANCETDYEVALGDDLVPGTVNADTVSSSILESPSEKKGELSSQHAQELSRIVAEAECEEAAAGL